MWHRNKELVLGSGSNIVLFAGNAINIMLIMHDHKDKSLFLDHTQLLSIFTLPVKN